MKKQTGFIQIPILISILAGVVIIAGVTYYIAHKKTTETATISSQQAEIDNLKNQIENVENKSNNNSGTTSLKSVPQPAKSISLAVKAPIDSADVRIMIIDKYNQTITDVKNYFNVTYPDYLSQSQYFTQKYPSDYLNSCMLSNSCDPAYMNFVHTGGEISNYVHKTFDNLAINYCDLNHSVLLENDRIYCHGVFDFTKDRNSNAVETLQKVQQDLKPWW